MNTLMCSSFLEFCFQSNSMIVKFPSTIPSLDDHKIWFLFLSSSYISLVELVKAPEIELTFSVWLVLFELNGTLFEFSNQMGYIGYSEGTVLFLLNFLHLRFSIFTLLLDKWKMTKVLWFFKGILCRAQSSSTSVYNNRYSDSPLGTWQQKQFLVKCRLLYHSLSHKHSAQLLIRRRCL